MSLRRAGLGRLALPRPSLRHGVAAVAWTWALLAGSATAAPLTLAVADLPHMAPALIAEAQGYFASEGLDVKVIHCVTGRRCLQHLVEGEAQLATAADLPIALAAQAGARFDIVATLSTSRDYRIVARADRAIARVADLKGKRIGFIPGTIDHYFIDTLLQFNDIASTAVTLVPGEPADIVERLVRGDLDAAALYQPLVDEVRQRPGFKSTLPDIAKAYTASINLVGSVSPRSVRDEELVKVLRALRRACELIVSQPDVARAVLARRLHLEVGLLQAIWPDFDFRLSLEQSMLTTLEAQSRWALRAGVVRAAAAPDFLAMVRPGPLRTVDPRAVSLAR